MVAWKTGARDPMNLQGASILKRLIFASCLLSLSSWVSATTLDANEQQMVDWIDAHEDEAIALLEETVNIGSGTMNHAGIRKLGKVMSREISGLGMTPE